MAFIAKSIRRSLKLLPFSFLSALQKQKLLLPLYHTVSDSRIPHIINLFRYKNVKQFEEDLDFLQKHFSPVSLQDVIGSIKSKKELPSKSFLLTFDDGYREIYDVIAPILKKRSLPAVFFINSAFLDNKEMFFRNKASLLIEKAESAADSKQHEKIAAIFAKHKVQGTHIKANIQAIKYKDRGILDELALVLNIDFEEYLEREKPYLSSKEVTNLIGEGFMIGSHSIDHPFFQLLSLEEQLRQVRESLNVLKQKFNLPVNAFAFPFNEMGVSKSFYEQTHFNGEIDISFGTSVFQKGHCDNSLQRQSMEAPMRSAKKIYESIFLDEIIKKTKNKLT